MLTHRNIVSHTEIVSRWIKNRELEEVGLIVLPLFHAFGLASLLIVMSSAGKVVLIPRFEPREVLRSIQRERATLFPGVPVMFSSLLDYQSFGKYDLSSLRACFSGATSLQPGIAQDFMESTGTPLFELYGLSEVSGAATFNPLDDSSRGGSVGVALPTIQIRILGLEDSSVLPPGEIGEIAIKGPTVMTGYWHETKKTIDENGWFRTGDLGKMDNDHYLYFIDRKKDLINVSGYKVFPSEVEDVISEHLQVKDVAVIGSKDEAMNEVVTAFVSLKSGAQVSVQDIMGFCRERIIHYKVPKRIELRDDLPKSIIGKVIKSSLK
jgi:long-chain acyl-CoA synthetase